MQPKNHSKLWLTDKSYTALYCHYFLLVQFECKLLVESWKDRRPLRWFLPSRRRSRRWLSGVRWAECCRRPGTKWTLRAWGASVLDHPSSAQTFAPTSCYINSSQRPHRCCSLANNNEYIHHGQTWAVGMLKHWVGPTEYLLKSTQQTYMQ